jgi:acetyl-CoA carboxylase, biotin carboxylase subunit
VAIRRILIANRGEIAVRIIRSCRALGIEAIVAASEADRDSMPARLADRTVCIGPARASESYLRAATIVQAALGVGADAVHPGYGFLSERTELARLCEQQRLIFIGPTAAQLEAVGDKLRARECAVAAGVTTVPGGSVDSPAEALELGRQIGTPLLVKAVGGGGGRGLQRIEKLEQLPAALERSAAEALAAFGDARLYLERFVTSGRHVEVQVLGDGAGHVVHLGERDCSVQRRYQKLIEEAPAPGLAPELRRELQRAAVAYAASLGYRGAGTVEFLVDPARQACYFLEMNARIQVEHPVTEAVTGVDIVAEQIAIAAGAGLRLHQDAIRIDGCALECRVNAEDPLRDFIPCPGRAGNVQWPAGPGLRVDTHVDSGSQVPPYYDSLLGKVIAHAADRGSALELMGRALADTRIAGIATNLDFLAAVVADAEFGRGAVDTGFLARFLGRWPGGVERVAHG